VAVETPTDQLTDLPPLIPRDVLFGNPVQTQARLSPDGTKVSYLAPVNGILNLFVGGADGSEPRQVTQETTRSLQQYTWALNSRHLLFLKDGGGDENWHVHSVDTESGEIVDRTPFPGVSARILAGEAARPDELLVLINKDNPQLHDVYLLNLANGTCEVVEEIPGFLGLMPDHDF